jgi:AraC-like DNA-binding protein
MHLRRFKSRRRANRSNGKDKPEVFLEDLSELVIERFARLTKLQVVCTPLDLPWRAVTPGPHARIPHPTCKDYADTDYCREAWQSHLAELRRRPEVHWHKCDFGLYCASVPVAWQDRCLAALQLVSARDMPEDAFAHNVELLDVLVEAFIAQEAEFLKKLLPQEGDSEEAAARATGQGETPSDQHPDHPQVLRALEYIEEHLSEHDLTVAHVAQKLDINPTYLAHLFAKQVGVRMSRHIADRRIRFAKNLLATTEWQIKRVAYESGYANPDWFSHVFHARAGITPGEYRRNERRS